MNLFYIFVFILQFTKSYESNILVILPHPGYSHFRVFHPIFNSLIKNGHSLTVVSYFHVDKSVANYNEIILNGEFLRDDVDLTYMNPSRSFLSLFKEFQELNNEGYEACMKFFNSNITERIREIHSKQRFDLLIFEFFNTDCILGLIPILKVPLIGLSSCALMPWHYDRVGLSDWPSFIPSEFVGFSDEMNFFERLQNFITTKSLKLLYRITEIQDNKMIQDYLNISVDVKDIAKETSLLLVNQHYSLSGPRPLSSKVIEIGGAHIDTVNDKSISKDLEIFLNESKNGIIFISWGSMIKFSTLPVEKLNSILNALNKLGKRIVWKWEEEERLPTNNTNYFFSKWLPQKELLCHPKIQVFWSHGGLLGISEACYCEIPVIVTPIYGDQFLNGRATEQRKFGKILNFYDITEENVLNTFSEVLQSSSYSTNAKYVGSVYKNRQNSPITTAVWWIEHVLETNGNNLTYSPSVHYNSFIYYSIDAITIIITLLLIFLMVIVCLWKLCKRKFFVKNEINKKKIS